MNDVTPARLRALKRDAALRPFDLAARLGLPEAALAEADLGHGAVRVDPAPSRLIPAVQALGEVMALTRNPSCVIEKVGTYDDFHDGDHAAMTLDAEIDLRLFPRHWVHAYCLEAASPDGARRSIQVFDAAGDAVHKVHLRAGSDLAAWDALIRDLALPDQDGLSDCAPRAAPQGAEADPARADALRAEWTGMTDTHQFNTVMRRLKMNRLGAYRTVGAPHARPLAVAAVGRMFEAVQAQGQQVMLFVGNMGCIQIHSGTFHNLRRTGPWLNVLDARFDLHLRADQVAEVWLVDRPARHGRALSVEAFDAAGNLIFQCFGMRPGKGGDAEGWARLVAALPREGAA